MKNKCKKCSKSIKKGEIYCKECQDQMKRDTPIEYMKAMMRGDDLTAKKIKEDNPNFEVSTMVMSDSNGGTFRVCSKCGFKNKGDFLFFGEYSCSKCGNKI
ncbi:MAG: hypothetical protein ACFFG0_48880 [Candidatus Thorarchaeota archaeon]